MSGVTGNLQAQSAGLTGQVSEISKSMSFMLKDTDRVNDLRKKHPEVMIAMFTAGVAFPSLLFASRYRLVKNTAVALLFSSAAIYGSNEIEARMRKD